MANKLYLALLRGINVGGGNVIKMADLRACFEASKCENAVTYIQSGNVLFESTETDKDKLVRKLEKAISRTFSPYPARIVLRSHAEVAQVVQEAPKNFGKEPQKFRYDVIYLKEPMTATAAMTSVSTKPGVNEVAIGSDVLYFSRLIAKAAQSHMARIVSLPVCQHMTVRNWNTTSRILALMDRRSQV